MGFLLRWVIYLGTNVFLLMPKPAIGALGLISFEACIDGSAVLQTLSKLRTRHEVKCAHIEGIRRLIMDGVGAVDVG